MKTSAMAQLQPLLVSRRRSNLTAALLAAKGEKVRKTVRRQPQAHCRLDATGKEERVEREEAQDMGGEVLLFLLPSLLLNVVVAEGDFFTM